MQHDNQMTMEELMAVNRYAESTKSLSFLPQVSSRGALRPCDCSGGRLPGRSATF